jgi:carboxyl-terminal processing protease
MAASLAVVLCGTGMVLADRSFKDDLYRALGNLAEVVHLVHTQYVDKVDLGALGEGLDGGIVESVDPWAAALDDAELAPYKELLAGPPPFGIELGLRFGTAAVRRVVAGSPAEAAGFAPWEILEKVEGRPTRGMPLWRVRLLLAEREKAGGAISLVVVDRQVEKRRTVELEARPWQPHSIDSEAHDGVSVVALRALPTGTTAAVKTAAGTGPRVLDLRTLGWGVEDEALAVADLFVDHGELGHWKGRRAGERDFKATPTLLSGPLPVVLIGGHTEGVGEVLAAALKAGGCTLVGSTTLGHAPHMMFVNEGGLHLWIPVAHWLRGDGKPIDGNGVEPDVKVAPPAKSGDDPVLKRALEIAREGRHATAA